MTATNGQAVAPYGPSDLAIVRLGRPEPDGDGQLRLTLGAFAGQNLAGLLVARLEGERAHLETVLVHRAHRRRGAGRRLVAALAEVAPAYGIGRLTTLWDAAGDHAAALSRILDRCGWAPPSRIFGVTVGRQVVEAPWLSTPVPRGLEVFPLAELSPRERQAVGSMAPAGLGLDVERPLEPTTSLGLRRDRAVVGWLVTHRADLETVRYGRLFVDPAHRRGAAGVALLGAAIRAQAAAEIPRGTFVVDRTNRPMIALLARRLLRYAVDVTETAASYLELTAGTTTSRGRAS